MNWQPEDTKALVAAIERLERELPGWWWSVGACHVSADASIGPDSASEDAELLKDRLFDHGFHCDLRQPATCAQSLNQTIDEALAAKSAAMGDGK